MHESKLAAAPSVEIWGTGNPLREFLHVDDLAEACYFLMKHYDEELFVNVGYGSDVSIRELAQIIRGIVGFSGDLVFEKNKPDGTPKKLMDSGRIFEMGWKPRIPLKEGIEAVYSAIKNSPDFFSKP
jgi:GDP-L-fucose synthase